MRVFTQAPRQCLHCSPVCRKQPEIPHLFCLYMACFFLLSCSFPGFPGTAVQTRAIQSTQHSLPLETGGLALGIGISASTFLVCRCPAICRLIIFFNPGSALILRTFSALVSFFVSCEAFRKAWICYGKPFWGQKIWAPIRKITEINWNLLWRFCTFTKKLPNAKRQCSRHPTTPPPFLATLTNNTTRLTTISPKQIRFEVDLVAGLMSKQMSKRSQFRPVKVRRFHSYKILYDKSEVIFKSQLWTNTPMTWMWLSTCFSEDDRHTNRTS